MSSSLLFIVLLLGTFALAVTFTPFTIKNHVLAVQPYLTTNTEDWLACLMACNNDPDCLSYNFQYKQEFNGNCELYNCSLDRGLVQLELVYSQGFVFQQLKQAKGERMCKKGAGGHCKQQQCHHGSTCVELINGYYCACAPGYTGRNCRTEINECSSNPCKNGACTDMVNDYQCACPPGFTGKRCEIDIDDCLLSRCYNNATCVDEIDDYRCICAPGYAGPACEANIKECKSSPCLNGGTCKDQVNGFLCECSPGYNGTRCELDIDECASNPCLHGGTCVNEVNRFTCNCKKGYSGDICGTKHNGNCDSDPCKNGGTCKKLQLAGHSFYWCSCPSNYWGYTCEKIKLNG